jgi:hypothetical protein
MQSVRATSSTPLIDATVYRPGAPLACAIVLPPLLGAIGLIAARFVAGVAIPLWAALALAGWALLAPIFWLLMKTVRVTAFSVATGRIWTMWKEIEWADISRVEWRGGRIRIVGVKEAALSFAPGLLHNNRALRQYLSDRLGPRLTVTPLIKPREITTERPAIMRPTGVSATEMRARPALTLRLGALAVFTLASGAGAAAFLKLHAPWSYASVALCALVALAALLALAWLSRAVSLTEAGIGVGRASSRVLPWREVELIEVSANERVLRLRGARKLRCPGPGFYSQPTRDTYRWLLHVYCIDRGVPAMRRPGVW